MRGSIQQSGPSSWRIQIELTRVGDKRKRRVVRIQGTRKDAQRELTRLLSAADAGTLPDPTRQTIGGISPALARRRARQGTQDARAIS